ncbi:MAG: chemotaxis protein CheD [Gemmatimonadales bacterium]
MTSRRLFVGISELEVARAPATLSALALGSCVGVILHDPVAKVGGLAHVLLPSPHIGRPRVDAPGRFAPSAVTALLESMASLGAELPRVTARLVGGASMFAQLQPAGTIQMGERNVHAVREALHRSGVRVTGEAVGGDFGRSVDFDVESGAVVVTSYAHGRLDL